jgi:hypothetical protein
VYENNTKIWFVHSWVHVCEIVDDYNQGKVDFVLNLRDKEYEDDSGKTKTLFWDNDEPHTSWFFDAQMTGLEKKTWVNFVAICKEFVGTCKGKCLDLFKPDSRLPINHDD